MLTLFAEIRTVIEGGLQLHARSRRTSIGGFKFMVAYNFHVTVSDTHLGCGTCVSLIGKFARLTSRLDWLNVLLAVWR